MVAVERGDAQYLRQLLELPEKQTLDFHGSQAVESPLTYAVCHGKHYIAEQLLHTGATADFQNGNALTPLMYAACNGDVHSIRLLLNYGADVNATSNRDKSTALHFTTYRDKHEAGHLLLENGAQPCERVDACRIFDYSPFVTAIWYNKSNMLKLFISYFKNKHLKLPLKLLITEAIAISSEKYAIIFLEQGVNVHQKPSKASSLAATGGQIKLMSLLVELNPQFLQEEWLMHRNIPERLQKHENYTSMLIKCRKEVPSLQKLCKSSIVSHLDS